MSWGERAVPLGSSADPPMVEGVRQLRGECGARQVKKHDTAMVHGNGGVLSAQASVILESAATV